MESKSKAGSMKTVYKNNGVDLKISSIYLGNKNWNAGDIKNYNNHRVYVTNESGVKIWFEFWQSVKKQWIRTREDLIGAFYCFLEDAYAAIYGYEEFCSDMGYDPCEKETKNIYKLCRQSLAKARKIGIEDEEQFCSILNDLQEKYNL